MRLFTNLPDWLSFRQTLPAKATLGFAPTMGNLHAGHASLFAASRSENDYSMASVYVNPKQFNNPEDYQFYPKTPEADLALMEQAGLDFCLRLEGEALYPDNYQYQLQENQLSLSMEGAHRPGHFNGVLTVVLKLLHLTNPTHIYFGEKDYQQYQLIQGMIEALFIPTVIKLCPTIREASGLALSSRNNRLSSEERLIAETFARLFHQCDVSCARIKQDLEATGISVDYIEELNGRRYAAVLIGSVRLIDNYANA